jgi:hypothetical protein
MNWLKSLFWMLVGVGLTLYLSNDNHQVQSVGTTLCLISLLGRLLLYLRDTAPAWERINAAGAPKLSILETAGFEHSAETLSSAPTPVATPGSTPVQRLIHDESER